MESPSDGEALGPVPAPHKVQLTDCQGHHSWWCKSGCLCCGCTSCAYQELACCCCLHGVASVSMSKRSGRSEAVLLLDGGN